LDLVIHGAAATGFNLIERVYREVMLRGDQDAKTASIRMRKCRRVCDGRGAYPD
jgi:hypothetical protein